MSGCSCSRVRRPNQQLQSLNIKDFVPGFKHITCTNTHKLGYGWGISKHIIWKTFWILKDISAFSQKEEKGKKQLNKKRKKEK